MRRKPADDSAILCTFADRRCSGLKPSPRTLLANRIAWHLSCCHCRSTRLRQWSWRRPRPRPRPRPCLPKASARGGCHARSRILVAEARSPRCMLPSTRSTWGARGTRVRRRCSPSHQTARARRGTTWSPPSGRGTASTSSRRATRSRRSTCPRRSWPSPRAIRPQRTASARGSRSPSRWRTRSHRPRPNPGARASARARASVQARARALARTAPLNPALAPLPARAMAAVPAAF